MATVAPTLVGRAKLGRAWTTPLAFLSPAVALVIVFFAVPVVLIVVLSFTDMSTATGLREWNFIGWENYRRILNHPRFGTNAQATIFYVVATLVLFNVGLALVIAILSTHIPRRTGFAFRALWLLPRITPVAVYIMMWRRIAERGPFGILNFHLLEPFLGGAGRGLIPQFPWEFVIITNGLVGASFGMILFASAIESIPRDFMNAALVDGCGLWQRIRFVILPSLKWPLLFVITYQTLSLLTSFEYILLLTDGNFGTTVWSLWSYQTALATYFGNLQYGLGAAMAVILVLIGIVASVVYLRFFRFSELVEVPKIETL
ncbi:MAG: carbohydrate ABC transporter permease [Acidimicrobiales bacterium]